MSCLNNLCKSTVEMSVGKIAIKTLISKRHKRQEVVERDNRLCPEGTVLKEEKFSIMFFIFAIKPL